MTDQYIAIFLVGILLVGGALFAVVALTKKSGRALNVAKYQSITLLKNLK